LQATVTLVDARNISNERYLSHEIFNQQIEVADIVIASKADLYVADELKQLTQYVESKISELPKPIHAVKNGFVKLAWLNREVNADAWFDDEQAVDRASIKSNGAIFLDGVFARPLTGHEFTCHKKSANGYSAIGWQFSHEIQFDPTKLRQFYNSLRVLRIKGVLNVGAEALVINQMESEITIENGNQIDINRLELIDINEFDQVKLEVKLRACFLTDDNPNK